MGVPGKEILVLFLLQVGISTSSNGLERTVVPGMSILVLRLHVMAISPASNGQERTAVSGTIIGLVIGVLVMAITLYSNGRDRMDVTMLFNHSHGAHCIILIKRGDLSCRRRSNKSGRILKQWCKQWLAVNFTKQRSTI